MNSIKCQNQRMSSSNKSNKKMCSTIIQSRTRKVLKFNAWQKNKLFDGKSKKCFWQKLEEIVLSSNVKAKQSKQPEIVWQNWQMIG